MKRNIFCLVQILLLLIFFSCEKYELPDSNQSVYKKQIKKKIIGTWELEKILVNGFDSTNHIISLYQGGGQLIIKEGGENFGYKLYSDFSSTFIFYNGTSVWSAAFELTKFYNQPSLYALAIAEGSAKPNNFIGNLGPNINSLNGQGERGSIYIRELTAHKLILLDNDQLDNHGRRITNLLYFFKK